MNLPKIEFLYPLKDGMPEVLLPRRANISDYEWFTKMPPSRNIPGNRKMPTVRICPGMMDTMTHGYIIPLPCDLEFEVLLEEGKNPKVRLLFANNALIKSVVSHASGQFTEMLEADKEGGWFNIKINTGILVKSTGHVDMLYTKPFYHTSNLFEAIPGTVDHAIQPQLHFNLKWKCLKSGVYKIKAGTPMLQAIPLPKKQVADVVLRKLVPQEARTISEASPKLFHRGDYRIRQKAFYEKDAATKCPISKIQRMFYGVFRFFLRK